MKERKFLFSIQLVILLILFSGCVSEGQMGLNLTNTNVQVIEPSDTSSLTPTDPPPDVIASYIGWIAFLMNDEGQNDIVLLAPDFDKTIKLGMANKNPRALSWSPNYDFLAMIIFQNGNSEVYLINLECVELEQDCVEYIEKIQGGDETYWGDLEWSPDGKYLVTSSLDYSSQEKPTLEIIGIDPERQLDLPEIVGWDPSWSPDGSSILFTAPLQCEQGCQGEIKVLTIDTFDLRDFPIPELLDAYEAKWSPDGKQIIFTSSDFYNCDGFWCSNEDIYIINADGTNLQLIAKGGYKSNWSPDGSKIVFQRDDGLYSVKPDGSELIQILVADEMGFQMDPSWSQ